MVLDPPRPHWISIHALLTEGDGDLFVLLTYRKEFQSTPSSRRATCEWADYPAKVLISIHALLTEGDFRHCFVVK